MKVLITGGAGFVGSNYIHYAIENHPEWEIINLDKLTYAGNLDNLKDIQNHPRHQFVKGDITDAELVRSLLSKGVTLVVNFAAETHVDRSIVDPTPFVGTNVKGTQVLLDAIRTCDVKKLVHISTPEVYGGASPSSQRFREESPFLPNNPYSASKAAADMLCRAYHLTYGVDVSLTRFANAFGPYQYPEKLLPLSITHALRNKTIPIYGDGRYRRNWIYIGDVCCAVDMIVDKGSPGEAYNIGSEVEMTNLELVHKVLKKLNKPSNLISFIPDRPAHDWQYPLDSTKITEEIGWKMACSFEEALTETIEWYTQNEAWWSKLGVLEYAEYYQKISNHKSWASFNRKRDS